MSSESAIVSPSVISSVGPAVAASTLAPAAAEELVSALRLKGEVLRQVTQRGETAVSRPLASAHHAAAGGNAVAERPPTSGEYQASRPLSRRSPPTPT